MRKLFFILLFLPLFLTQCEQSDEKKGKGGIINVSGVIVQPELFKSEISLVADLLPIRETILQARISGLLTNIYVKEGQIVKKGQPILTVSHLRAMIQKNAMLAELAIAERDYERKKALFLLEASTKEELELIEDKIILLKAGIDDQDVTIELAKLEAPFNGRLGMFDITVGTPVVANQPFTTLTQSDTLKVNFNIPFDLTSQVSLNSKIKTIVGKDTLQAFIYAINPSIDKNAKTLQIRAYLKTNNHTNFIPGAYAQVLLEVDRNEEAVVIPTSAVTYDINQQTVYILKNGKAQRQKIKAGTVTPDKIEIKEGLAFGDTLITTGLLQVKEGMSVNLTLTKP